MGSPHRGKVPLRLFSAEAGCGFGDEGIKMGKRCYKLLNRCAWVSGVYGGIATLFSQLFCASLCAFALIIFLPTTVQAAQGRNVSGILEESYDSYLNGFLTEYKEGYTVIADLPNGMLATSDVCVYCLDGRMAAVYRNGEPFTPELVNDRSYFRQSGAYTIMISDASDASLPKRVFSFRIIDKETLDLKAISIPTCVTVLELQRDGESLDIAEHLSNGVLDLRTAGKYTLIWQVGNADQMTLSFHVYNELPLFAIDRSDYSAMLTFSNGLDHMKVYQGGKLVYSASDGAWSQEREAWVLVRDSATGDQQTVQEDSFSLSEAGTYTVFAYAENGDARMETVSVAKKRDVLGFSTILILAVGAAVLMVFLTGEKRKQSVVR